MRTIVTFVLRLLVDDELPHQVSGALHTILRPQVYPFRDGPALLELLSELSRPQPGGQNSPDLPPAGGE